MIKKTKYSVAILLFFSALVVVVSLLATARTRELEDRSEKLIKEICLAQQDNLLLKARCENLVSIEELERYAVDMLGMQRISPCQIYSLETDVDVVIG